MVSVDKIIMYSFRCSWEQTLASIPHHTLLYIHYKIPSTNVLCSLQTSFPYFGYNNLSILHKTRNQWEYLISTNSHRLLKGCLFCYFFYSHKWWNIRRLSLFTIHIRYLWKFSSNCLFLFVRKLWKTYFQKF